MNKQEAIAATNQMSTINHNGRKHVIRNIVREGVRCGSKLEPIPDPNFLGTNCALVAVLRKGETLSSFKDNWIKKQCYDKRR